MAGDSSCSEAVAKAKTPLMVKGENQSLFFFQETNKTESASCVTFDWGKHFYYYYFVFKTSVQNERKGRWLPKGRGASQRMKETMKVKGRHRHEAPCQRWEREEVVGERSASSCCLKLLLRCPTPQASADLFNGWCASTESPTSSLFQIETM